MRDTSNQSKIQQLIRKGVRIDRPETITIGEEVLCDQISDNNDRKLPVRS